MPALPPHDEMIKAFLERDASYEGIFFTGVLTTGIFCRPTCSARKPKPENVRFFRSTKDALNNGFRPCKRCYPMEMADSEPDWVRTLIADIENDPLKRWRDQDLRDRGVEPETARRWFKKHHGMTFHAFSRSRRLGQALGHMKEGTSVTEAAFEHGYESLTGSKASAAADDHKVVYLDRIRTPLGPMLAGATDTAVCLLEFIDRPMLPTQLERVQKRFQAVFIPESNDQLNVLRSELDAYFEGKLTEFSVPLDYPGTAFQEKVWHTLMEFKYGTTGSYLDLATKIGDNKAVRAVARANGDNRIAIIIPCHRIIGSDGSLTGYGGGLHRKKWLLELESGIRELSLFD